MRKRYLAALTALVMLITAIPAGSGTFASEIESTPAPSMTLLDTVEATPAISAAPAAQETAQPSDAPAAKTDDAAVTPAGDTDAQSSHAPAVQTDDAASTPAGDTDAQSSHAPAVQTDDAASTPAGDTDAQPSDAPAVQTDDAASTPAGEGDVQPTDAPAVTAAPVEAPVFEIRKDVLVRYHGEDRKVVIPKGVREIGKDAFRDNERLEKVVLGEDVEVIGERAFAGCTELETVIINDKLAEIKSKAFEDCRKLDPTFAADVEKVAGSAFKGCLKPATEPSEEPTDEPTTEPSEEPTEEPTAEPVGEPTDSPAGEPTTEPEPATPSDMTDSLPTLEPDPTEEPADEDPATDTDLPADDNLATDTDLPEDDYLCGRVEHTHDAACFGEDGALCCGLEEHVHTADCLVYPLTLSLSGDALFVYANEEPAVFRADIAGGRAPYTLQVGGEILPLGEDSSASAVEAAPSPVDSEGVFSFLYAPVSGGMHCLTVTVTDAEGRTASAEAVLPVSIRTNETDADWRATFAQAQLTGDPRADVIAIARTQLGYTASRTDFTVQPGGDWMHYSRYGAWYGSPYINWCAAFAGFCLHYAGVTDVPFHSNCGEWLDLLQAQGLYRPADAYFPMPGDVVFIDHDGNGVPNHIGLVEAVTVTRTGDEAGFRFTLSTIEGNREGQVGCFSYDASDATILGYGQIAGSVGDGFTAVIEALIAYDAAQAFTGSEEAAAGLVFQRLQAALDAGLLSEEDYTALWMRLGMMLYGDVAERAEGTNWMRLRSSGWFNAYSAYANVTEETQASDAPMAASYALRAAALSADEPSAQAEATPAPSDVQVNNRGGSNTSADGAVSVSKTIAGTDLENVFDITLQVQTSMKIEEITSEPDMAVVIVMDISNTMNDNFGGVTRYAAAMTAAESFLDQFAASNSLGISKVGYVAFNTNAHEIFGLSSCTSQSQANSLKNTMRTQTGSIINAAGYAASHSRFTNVEAGLAMANDMLSGVSNKNKYIIFLSDGFPTTYIRSGYSGYDPYDSTGRFYDHVLNKPCLYGTSYSDEAAIRARNKAAAIKASGTTIFSIGVDVAGQTIQTYITQSEKASAHSVVDHTGTTYEIGDASSTEAYKNWLRNSIGSGYYYDSTNTEGLKNAYKDIFAEIKHKNETGAMADWVASDPLPVSNDVKNVEFIGFYGKNPPSLVTGDLSGTHAAGGENTASFSTAENAISWNLKKSGYTSVTSGDTTTYTYQLVYRVRLTNESGTFVEGTIYPTNGTTTLRYRTVETVNGNQTVSAPKTVNFPIPLVKGYLSELRFTKVDQRGDPLAGVTFTLAHDTTACSACRGDGTPVDVPDMTATSDTYGMVSFSHIPSGHVYTLTEDKPAGAVSGAGPFRVTVAYDQITVDPAITNGTVANRLTTLTVSKEVRGSDELKDDPFDFTLTLSHGTASVDGVYRAFYTAAGTDTASTITVADGKATFTLTHGQQMTIYGLPVGTLWRVTEDTPGYKVTVNGTSGVTANGTLTKDASVAYVNQSMARLPETGGPGRTLYTWAGIMLCMLSVLLYKLLKRRMGMSISPDALTETEHSGIPETRYPRKN